MYPDELRYNKEHTWLRLEDDASKKGRVGITYYAQDQLKEVVFIELPEVGDSVVYMESFGIIESAKATNDLYSPVSGLVVEVNKELEREPGLVNQDPYGNGWLYMIEPSNLRKNLKDLLYGEDAGAWLEDEASRLLKRIETDVGATAHDGGRPVSDIYGSLDGEEWSSFLNEFLLTK